MYDSYLNATRMLNYDNKLIQQLITEKKWRALDEYHQIVEIYDFVQNDIRLGYNKNDLLQATDVLKEQIGQCNTKATLLMALLRAVGIPCRLHGFAVNKDFQATVIPRIVMKFVPDKIVHTWVEVRYQDEWTILEGVIVDFEYIQAVQLQTNVTTGPFYNYAIAIEKIETLISGWSGKSTFVQSTSIVEDYGVFDSPDTFFKKYNQNLSPIKAFLYAYCIRKVMNRNVKRIRDKK